jgi:hypothetical protein
MDFSSPKEISGDSLKRVSPESCPPVSSDNIFLLSVELSINSFPRIYFFAKIYAREKMRGKKK